MTQPLRAIVLSGVLLAALSGIGSISASAGETSADTDARAVVTIDFAGLAGANGSAFASYKEHGFRVLPAKTSAWLVGQNYGDPPPYIYVEPPAGPVRSTIRITGNGAAFTFKSVDVYSSITPIPYVFRGTLKGVVVFAVRGTVPNTFGNFATAKNRRPSAMIDALEISITDPDSENAMGLDTIRLGGGG